MNMTPNNTEIANNNYHFEHIIKLINIAKENTFRKVNEELISLYFAVGQYLSQESKTSKYGDKFIDEVAETIKEKSPNLKGFNKRGLYRMKQFYELYQEDTIVSPVMTQLNWTQHLKIMSACKTQEQRHFYIELAIKEKYSSRELKRQIDSAYFERAMLSKEILLPAEVDPKIKNHFLDTYVLDFLDLPQNFSEKEFKNAILANYKNFLLEIGKGFTFVGDEYRVQVGKNDFFIDLLFYHRELACLVAFELKIGEFKPEYLGKMNFYLEALDNEHKKEHENPSVGIILCASKDDEVVKFALNRSLSPTLVADYTLKLPDSKLLQSKLHELSQLFNVKD